MVIGKAVFCLVVLCMELLLSKEVVKRTPKYDKKNELNSVFYLITAVVCCGFFVKFGMTMLFVKASVIYFIFLFSSVLDIQTREVPDWVHFTLIVAGFISVNEKTVLINILSAVVVFLFMLICAMLSKNKLGGADVKFISAMTFVLGLSNSLLGLMLGLVLSIIGTKIRNYCTKKKDNTMPLIPYLSIGFLVSIMIGGM